MLIRRKRLIGLAVAIAAMAVALIPSVAAATEGSTQQPTAADLGVPSTQDPEPPTPTTAAPVVTTTLPESDSQFGRIIPKPNSGVEPQSPGDRGGWEQTGLFFLICAVIAAMALFVWWRSRVARTRRLAAGHDPVAEARLHGADVRAPRPPGIVD